MIRLILELIEMRSRYHALQDNPTVFGKDLPCWSLERIVYHTTSKEEKQSIKCTHVELIK